MNPKLVPGYCAVGLYVLNASSINALTTAFECVPSFVRVPIKLPINPCSIRQPRIGAYSIPNTSRCLSFMYSVKVKVFQSSILRDFQSFAGGNRLVILAHLANLCLLFRTQALSRYRRR